MTRWVRAVASMLLVPILAAGTINVASKTSSQSTSSNAYVDVDDLTFEVAPDTTYQAQWVLVVSTASALVGAQIAVNGPSSPTAVTATITSFSGIGAATSTNVNAYDEGLNPITSAGSTRIHATVRATIVNGPTAGVVSVRVRSSDNGTAVTVHQGSSLVYHTP